MMDRFSLPRSIISRIVSQLNNPPTFWRGDLFPQSISDAMKKLSQLQRKKKSLILKPTSLHLKNDSQWQTNFALHQSLLIKTIKKSFKARGEHKKRERAEKKSYRKKGGKRCLWFNLLVSFVYLFVPLFLLQASFLIDFPDSGSLQNQQTWRYYPRISQAQFFSTAKPPSTRDFPV